MKSGTATNNNIEIAYEALGNKENPTLLLISGLGSQLVYWTDELCQVFLDRGFHVVRFDNRDAGLSSKSTGATPDPDKVANGPPAPYTLSDMAADSMAVLDDLNIDAAHILGVSLGGMIAQTIAIEHPHRTLTLTSIMSAVKPSSALPDDEPAADDEAAQQRKEAIEKSVTIDLTDPATFVERHVEAYRITSGPHFDEALQLSISQRTFDRSHHPEGWTFQIAAARASGDRTEMLRQLSMPALVIHGVLDPLIPASSGEETASAIPNAKLLLFDDMGHNLPRPRWADIAQAVHEMVTMS